MVTIHNIVYEGFATQWRCHGSLTRLLELSTTLWKKHSNGILQHLGFHGSKAVQCRGGPGMWS